MRCSQTFQFVANRQENILRKYDECLICLLLFVCQPVYLCEIYALQFFLIQKQVNKAEQSGSLGVCGCLSIFKILCFIHVMQRHRCMYVYDFQTYVFADLCLFAHLHYDVPWRTTWKEIKKGRLPFTKHKDKSRDRERERSSSPSAPVGVSERC